MQSPVPWRIAVVASVLGSCTTSVARAQRVDESTALRVAPWRPPGVDSAPAGAIASQRPSTTFGQRFFTGALFAWAAAGTYWLSTNDEEWGWTVATYTTGSTLGVLLATRARAGAHPLGTVLGALVGAAPGIIVALQDPDPEGPGGDLALGYVFLLTAPLGASIGHEMGR